MLDPHMAGHCKQYVRTRCNANNCDELAPIRQDPRWRWVYCRGHQLLLEIDAARIALEFGSETKA